MNDGHGSLWPREYIRNFRPKKSLRFAALTWGTRGDVQPFVALGAELLRRGHRVLLAARAPFRSFVEEHGLEFHEMEEDGTEDLMRALAKSDGGPQGIGVFVSSQRDLVGPQFRQFWEASEGADALICNSAFTAPALHIAEHRGLPVFQAFFDPGFVPTSRYCMADDRIQDFGPFGNMARTRLRNVAAGLLSRDIVNAWRKERGMKTLGTGERHHPDLLRRLPVLAAWSPQLIERPDDWPAWFAQTGRFRLPVKDDVSPRLRAFMEKGPAPVYIGFGSWGVHEKTELTELLLETLRITGDRAIFHRNTVDDRRAFPEGVYVDDDLPHDWLFPRMKAVVHHGGAGTTGAVATAGVPSIIIPAFFAQAVWGDVLIRKGIGTLLVRRELSAERLARALQWIDHPHIRERARALGERARTDRGEAHAADEIERRLQEAAEHPGGRR
ncbi:glycosyltransferase [Polyangium aurulentum]|uniref:glycosyltransferase n=1 Tax=Polyangium aurulentum TaxID=2567896 RepID=UPI0010ADE81F|nr:glycosyltransferase [Polyangium aurulentum]UQA59110.1 glycosyltransferase [Polyangium aurulentum]